MLERADAANRESLRDAYLLCRTISHSWRHAIDPNLDRPMEGWRFSLQCTRCKTRRHDVISHDTGELLQRRYVHPDDYDIGERVTRSELRVEIGRRQMFDFITAKRSNRKK
jgi:hypothetical protein